MHDPTFMRPNGVKDEQMRSTKEYLLDEHRMVFLDGVIRDARCQTCGAAGDADSANLILALASHSSEPIKMLISSPGGAVETAMMIYDTIKLVDAPIITIGRFCGSAAAILMAAGTERYLLPRAKMMLHLPSGIIAGNTAQLEIQQEEMRKTRNDMVDALIECGVNKTRTEILEDMANGDKWFNPQEAIDYGLADSVVTTELLKGWLTK
ncbi:hypothetical protein LCGC14_1687080 [marine sediment metagenome]|uniref:Endopeptidase Clp n=1 Tax=marine sediment metagenome TaxID=412755 RepID=A0A0F9KLY9_9ZZZZ